MPIIQQANYYVVYYWAHGYKRFTRQRIKSVQEILSKKMTHLKYNVFI